MKSDVIVAFDLSFAFDFFGTQAVIIQSNNESMIKREANRDGTIQRCGLTRIFHILFSVGMGQISLTPCFSKVNAMARLRRTVSTVFRNVQETVKTVAAYWTTIPTLLKQGVNETAPHKRQFHDDKSKLGISLWCVILLLHLAGHGLSGQVLTNLAFTKIRADTNGLFLQWDGAYPPFTLEHTATPHLPESWQSVPIYPNDNACRLPPSALQGFYRVCGVLNPPWGAYLGQWRVQEDQVSATGLLARYRLKSIWNLYEPLNGSSGTIPADYYKSLLIKLQYLDENDVITRVATLTSFPNASVNTPISTLTANWCAGEGSSKKDFSLNLSFPYSATVPQTNMLISDPVIQLTCSYATPQIEIISQQTTNITYMDAVYLCQVNEISLADRHLAGGNETVNLDSSYSLGVPLRSGTTNYYDFNRTMLLRQWNSTVISGLTAHPLELTSAFSQTYFPSRHNLLDTLVFEPASEPGISPAVLADLRKADIKTIIISAESISPSTVRLIEVQAIGFDYRIRTIWQLW